MLLLWPCRGGPKTLGRIRNFIVCSLRMGQSSVLRLKIVINGVAHGFCVPQLFIWPTQTAHHSQQQNLHATQNDDPSVNTAIPPNFQTANQFSSVR